MSFKMKPLSVAVIATITVLAGCSTDSETIDKTTPTQSGLVDANTGEILTAKSGLVCKDPDLVQVIDEDFYPLTSEEITALEAVALAITYPDGATEEQATAFSDSFDAYDFDFGATDLYPTLGLTNEELARQAVAKEEARAFKIEQGQDLIFDAEGAYEGGFDAWFEDWFATVPETDYLGASQRIARAARGYELSLGASNDDEEVCYTPPTDCPNYKLVDETLTYDCIIPEENIIEGAPEPTITPAAGQTVMYFRINEHSGDGSADEALYQNITIHTWNNSNCSAYDDASTTTWGTGKGWTAIDPNYGAAWVLDLADAPDSCGNMIVYDKVSGEKFITQNDAMIPLGQSGDLLFHNLNKISYFQEGFPANVLDGVYLANQHPFFGASAGSKSCAWGTSLDESGEACLGQELSCPDGTIAIGVGATDISSRCIEEMDLESVELLVRGGFNGWGETNPATQVETGLFVGNVAYGSHAEDASLEHKSDAAITLALSEGDTLTIPQAEDDEGNPVETTFDPSAVPAGTVLTMVDGTEITFEGEGMLTFSEGTEVPAMSNLMVTIPAGTSLMLAEGANHGDIACVEDCLVNYGFKIADKDWGDISTFGGILGGDTPAVGTEVQVTPGNGVGQDIFVKFAEDSVYQFALDYTSPEATMLKISELPVDALPYIMIDDMSYYMGYVNDGVFSYRANLEVGDYEILISDLNLGNWGAGDDTMLAPNTATALVAGDVSFDFSVTNAGDFDFYLSFADVDNPTIEVKPAKPLGETVTYIRGSLNGWGAPETDVIEYNEDTLTYSVIYGLEASTTPYQFKFASEDWSTVDLGNEQLTKSTDDDAVALTNMDKNFGITADESTSYLFEVSYAGSSPTVKVSKLPIYLRGGMNGWGATDQFAFNATDDANTNEAGHEYTVSIAVAAGAVQFKVATDDWSTINLGAPTDDLLQVAVDTEIELNTTNGNLALNPESATTYEFIFNEKAKTLTVSEE